MHFIFVKCFRLTMGFLIATNALMHKILLHKGANAQSFLGCVCL